MPARISDRVAVVALAALVAAGVLSLAARWGARAEYADRFLILLGAGWAAVRAWPTAPSSPHSLAGGLGLLLVSAAALAFPVAWLLQVQVGPRTLLLWWQWAAVAVAGVGLLLVRDGWRKVRVCGFALLFPMLALPIPDRILQPLQQALQVITTTASEAALALVYRVSRPGDGFVLQLPGGPLEVAEACSGVRSLTALVAIAAFVAFLRGFGPAGGGLLLAFSIPAVIATNVLRVFLSGVIQETFGAAYIQGDWHEALGFAMVLVGLAGILGLASAFGRLATPWVASNGPPGAAPAGGRILEWLAAGLVLASALGTGYAVRLGWLAVGASLASVPFDRIPVRLGTWQAKGDEPIPNEVTSKLAQDTASYRVYRNNLGQEVHCWLLYWSSLGTVHGYHHPDVCWGNRGGVPTYRGVVTLPAGGGEVPVTARRFDVTGGQNYILYWTQDGRRVWDAEVEASASRQGESEFSSGHGWVADLLVPPDRRRPGRLTVVLATRHTGPTAERETIELARRLADELYAVCPWAAPPHPPGAIPPP